MLIKGTCQKQNLMQAIHDAILSPGSNWTEVSSNKTNDYKWTGTITDGWVFKSPPIGSKGQRVFLNLKSIDLSVTPSTAGGSGGNHLLIWLADDYTPSGTANTNGTFTNKSILNSWAFCQVDTVYCSPTSIFDYFIDIQDHRIMIIVQRNNLTATTYPQFIYIGYPEPNTNIEGANYTNQFIIGSNLYSNATGIGSVYWHKASNGLYGKLAVTNCNLNTANPNPMGLYLINQITVTGDGGTGLANSGTLGTLTGLYGMVNSNIVNGDTLTIGSDTYQVFTLSQWSLNQSTIIGGTGNVTYYNGITPPVIAFKVS